MEKPPTEVDGRSARREGVRYEIRITGWGLCTGAVYQAPPEAGQPAPSRLHPGAWLRS